MKITLKIIERYVKRLLGAEECLTFKGGQYIYYRGHQPYGVYVVRSGRVQLRKSLQAGKPDLVQTVRAGQMFGDRELINKTPYTTSAVALEDAQIVFLSKRAIEHIISEVSHRRPASGGRVVSTGTVKKGA